VCVCMCVCLFGCCLFVCWHELGVHKRTGVSFMLSLLKKDFLVGRCWSKNMKERKNKHEKIVRNRNEDVGPRR
jgi:hypothetical protein